MHQRIWIITVLLSVLTCSSAEAASGDRQFSVATLNVDGLPTKILIISSNPDGPGSGGTEVVSQYLAQKGYDIIGVQEDFNYDSELRSSLEADYDYGEWQGGISLSGVNWLTIWKTKFDTDGLRLFWRQQHQMESEQAVRWTASYGKFDHCWDDMITKGFRRSEMTLEGGQRIVVYNMHLDASDESDVANGRDAGDVEARRSQWHQLRDSVMMHLDERPVILLGDMNSLYPSDSIKAIFIDPINATGRHRVADTWVEHQLGGHYPQYGETDRLTALDRGEVFDKILYINPTKGPRLKLETFQIEYDYLRDDGTPMGDHYPVSARFSFVDDDAGIIQIQNDETPARIFTIDGRQLSAPPSHPGVYIMKGKKVILGRN